MLRGLQYWKKYNHGSSSTMLVFGGERNEILNENTSLLSWKEVGDI